jgi:FKBP-type peptidyl-prolyl cis-trans isomerase FkpA
MKKNIMFLAVAAIGLASCGGGFKKGDGGFLYNIHTDKPTPNIKEGDFISINLVAKNDADSVLMSTYQEARQIPTLLQKPQFKGDVYSAFSLLSEGDSATVKISVDTMAKRGQPKPPDFKGKYIVYQIKVEKVIPRGSQTEQVFNNRITDYFKAQAETMKKSEPAKIKKYMDENDVKATQTASGLYYQITKEGSGAKLAPGDTAVVNYTGKLYTGKIFDSNIKEDAAKNKQGFDPNRKYEAIRIPVGVSAVIKGWDEGLLLLNKGSKATFVIPSKLAYGEQGMPLIPPYTPIAFNVELVDIVHPNPNAPKPAAPMPPAQAQVPVR